jgi:hypothetical protein
MGVNLYINALRRKDGGIAVFPSHSAPICR